MTPRLTRLWLAGLAGATTALNAQTPPASQPPPPPAVMMGAPATQAPAQDEEMIEGIKLTDATVDHVLMLLEDWTGRSILRPQQLPTPTFAINVKRRLPKSEAILALETLLNLNGIGVIPQGEHYLKVVDLPRMRMEAPQMIDGTTLNLPPSGQVATKLFQLEFQRINEIMPQLNLVLNGQLGGYVPLERSNAVLVTDSIANLQRIETLLTKLDQPVMAGLTPKFYQLKNGAKASDIVNKINAILQGPLQNQLGSATKFSADDRTNQIILLADQRQYPFFDDLIAKLDVKADPNTSIKVLYLKHGVAKDVANLLTNLISSQSKATQSAGNTRPINTTFNRLPNQPNQPPTPEPVQPVPNMNLGELGVNTAEFSSLVNVVSDDRSNAIVVSGTTDDIRLITEVVEQVDVLLAQVRIETVIAEVSLTDDDDNGISALGLQVVGDRLVGFGATTASASLGKEIASGGTSGLATITRPTDTGATGVTGSYDLAYALQLTRTKTKGRTTILSHPTITTTHNKEGTVIVSQQVPTISGFVSDLTGGTSSGTSNIGRTSVSQRDIGLTLTIKPLIGNDGSVQLDVKQELSEPGPTITIDGNPQFIVNRRSTESFVSVKSGEVLVLGGLQRRNNSSQRFRLGPIPIIGDLLGGRTKNNDRTDLVIFLRPQVLTGDPTKDNVPASILTQRMGAAAEVKAALDPESASGKNESEPAKIRRKR